MIRNLTLLLVLAAACGGKQPAPATTTEPAAPPAEGGHEMHHPDMPAEMTKFHDVLAPRWHAAKGPERMKTTCDAVPQFRTESDAIAKVTPPPKANADTWTTGTKALVDSIAELDVTCQANDAAKFEEAFHKVHESFHGLMMAAGMQMHMHEGGGHQHQHGGHQHQHGHGAHQM